MDIPPTIELLPGLAIIGLISLVDFVTLTRARLTKKYRLDPTVRPCHDFAILVPIFGDIAYLRNISFLKRYGNRVILCTTTKESAGFNDALERIAVTYGFQIFRSEVHLASVKHKPNPWGLFRGTLHGKGRRAALQDVASYINREIARDEIIRDSFEVVRATYCIFLDGDTVAGGDLSLLVGQMARDGLDLASVRVLASKQETLIEKLQAVEYELAMDARKIYPWLTSGACMVARTDVIRSIMAHHSLFFSGGDIEIGKLAKMLKYRVGHIPFVFFTDVPRTLRAWFRQRMAWFGGGFRHAVINIHQYTWRHPMFYFYMTFLVYLLLPLRWYEIIQHPVILPVIIVLYWLLLAVFHRRSFRVFYMLFPFYALLQVMVLVPLGIYTYFRMAAHSSNIGFIGLRTQQSHVTKYGDVISINS